MTTAILPIGILDKVAAQNVLLARPDEIDAYLQEHPTIGALLPAICMKAREAFGPAAELAIRLYHDPEIDDCYLTVYVRQNSYEPGILERIDAILSEFASELEDASGFLLLTTDFRRPGESDAV